MQSFIDSYAEVGERAELLHSHAIRWQAALEDAVSPCMDAASVRCETLEAALLMSVVRSRRERAACRLQAAVRACRANWAVLGLAEAARAAAESSATAQESAACLVSAAVGRSAAAETATLGARKRAAAAEAELAEARAGSHCARVEASALRLALGRVTRAAAALRLQGAWRRVARRRPSAAAASPGEVRRALDCVRLAEEGIEPAHAPLAACAAAAVCAASDQGVGGCPLREALPQSEPAPLEPEWLTQASDELRASPVVAVREEAEAEGAAEGEEAPPRPAPMDMPMSPKARHAKPAAEERLLQQRVASVEAVLHGVRHAVARSLRSVNAAAGRPSRASWSGAARGVDAARDEVSAMTAACEEWAAVLCQRPTTADVGAEPSGPVRSEPARGIGLAVKGAEAGAGAQAAGTTDEVLWGHLFERARALQHAMRTLSAEVDALCEGT
ncbi:hypothetical protein EMIHUDRAFT_203605 [Emiliania huxleyi CCMP1516]|uniref:Uncharacterized protein n=2 Tax=Emiliania huxleyi TaxID=2903 RepID=A0A0D3K2Y8_EMIH1|nr:hypothetical protein EMIHUDRAFT_203605 [Emiliania huxleyi CCMP1516]EOD30123.1 hypothetical protein EMIHUDRAFT_203605 [Emiliania huxleyi CCMP1516]|eukprot:XP_005782552.1 hypothetical protein EMIHUDRAFT_203605 [Emiliania huxleyi CCMP1516]